MRRRSPTLGRTWSSRRRCRRCSRSSSTKRPARHTYLIYRQEVDARGKDGGDSDLHLVAEAASGRRRQTSTEEAPSSFQDVPGDSWDAASGSIAGARAAAQDFQDELSSAQLAQELTQTSLRPNSYKKFLASTTRRQHKIGYRLRHWTWQTTWQTTWQQMLAKDLAEDVVAVRPEVAHAGRLFWRLPWRWSARRKRPLHAAVGKHD